MQKQSRLSKFSCFEFSRLKGVGGGGIILRKYAGGGGVSEKRTGAYKGGGCPKLAILLRTYFMDDPYAF